MLSFCVVCGLTGKLMDVSESVIFVIGKHQTLILDILDEYTLIMTKEG